MRSGPGCASRGRLVVLLLALAATAGPGAGEAADTASVERAHAWLLRTQGSNGSWAGTDPVMSTASALLALGSGRRGPGEQRSLVFGVRYLLTELDATGRIGASGRHRGLVAHAAAVCALAWTEADPGTLTRQAVRAGAAALVRAQQRDGGWYAGFGESRRTDLVSTVWALTALRAARGLEVDTSQALSRVPGFLARLQDPASGRFGQDFRGIGGDDMTGAGLYLLLLLGPPGGAEAERALAAMEKAVAGTGSRAGWSPWGSLFYAEALWCADRSLWERWMTQVREELRAHQRPDGSWPGAGRAETEGAVATTAACVLLLRAGDGSAFAPCPAEPAVSVSP